MTHAVPAIGRRYSIAARPSVDGDDLETVVGFRKHDEELGSLNDLPYGSHVEEAHIQGSKGRVRTAQRRVIFIGQSLGLRRGGRRIQAGKRGRRSSARSTGG